jgi:uroporphyrin-III C-methyltransferase / precorrin-2 dehydrogenase / sirohydrochlorin ferrochelatase
MSRPDYPLTLDVTGRRVVVVGGGPVAARRARSLLDAGALVEVISPWVCEDLADLGGAGALRWLEREYVAGDLLAPEPAWLAHTATGDPATDGQVAREAEAARVWCVRADDASASSAWTPAVARGASGSPSEGLTVAVTAGADPRRATAVRDAVLAALDSATLPVRRTREDADPRNVCDFAPLAGKVADASRARGIRKPGNP